MQELNSIGAGRLLRIEIVNFRSIAETALDLDDLTVLVGGNGAGKSNVVDAFRFVSESLTLGLYTALERRGGIKAVRHRIAGTGGYPRAISLLVRIGFERGFEGEYSFRISSGAGGAYSVAEERVRMFTSEGHAFAEMHLQKGRFRKDPTLDLSDFGAEDSPTELASIFIQGTPDLSAELLALPLVGGMPGVRSLLLALRMMRTYAIAPDTLREPQDPDEGSVLRADGRNASSVWRGLDASSRAELIDLLSYAVPGITEIRSARYGKKRGLEFTQVTAHGPNRFEAHQMSDGTLRLFGILLALLQPSASVVLAIEEPEVSIHLGALSALISVVEGQAELDRIVLTTHSAELMDLVPVDALRLVSSRGGSTVVEEVAEHSKSAVREELLSPGALFRAGGLHGAAEPVADPVE